MGRDFSKVSGRRLRITAATYDRARRTYKPDPKSIALVTVATAREHARLWKLIEATIEGGEWRDGAPGSAALAAGGGVDDSAVHPAER